MYSTIVELDFNHLMKFQGATESVAPLPARATVNDFVLWMLAGDFVVASYSMEEQVFTCRVSGLTIELSGVRAWAELPDTSKLV
ncbi:hypothetical protein [Pseudomonas sp. NPDC096950]|uniref:hypothetical protein n=1 Tax=Pseudomonas sp. NPDC096950 TaxID=3364485 RepID=UPI00383BE4DA